MIHASATVHPSAIVDAGARLKCGVSVGPYSIIGSEVELGEDTSIGPHVVITGQTRLGRKNRVFQFASVGEEPQDKKYAGEPACVEIGDGNTIREYCTINRGTEAGGGLTRLGDNNWVMAYVHVAHDCVVGNDIVMANGTTLGGHVTVGDHAVLGGFTLVHQFCRIGAHCMAGRGAVLVQDVAPYVTVAGNPPASFGINAEGLRRRGFSADTLARLKRAYKVIHKRGLGPAEAVEQLRAEAAACEEVALMCAFVADSKRGYVR
ncbi:MAG: acyl-ACP--UDP-N-acetylglucosamine O-acyltransferase [Gammaproteobacteria bacterium]